ncbi:type II secretion system F family protein [Candidatus Woesearchaeota archaeon]|nr:type II secretion system F family protein [Candidatus Woesearchaeota archaeon]
MAKIKFKTSYLLSIMAGIVLIALDVVLLLKTRLFFPVLIITLLLSSLHFWIDFFSELKRQKAIELMFLNFTRSLVESVKSGVSIPRSIQNVSKKNYGPLTPYIQKLAHQIEWGIPTRKALQTFSEDTENKVIKRSISLMVEAEQSGGDITDILSSVVGSVVSIKKMKEERKAMIHSQVVQGYIIYFVFIGIMLALDLWLFPQLGKTSAASAGSIGGLGGISLGGAGSFDLGPVFFTLIIVQGFFAGIMIGKFSEGTLKTGLLHSLIMMVSAALIITTLKGGI